MTGEIALILSIDGLATGTIYVLVGLGLVLVFSVTRVVFVPFGDVVAFSALTLGGAPVGSPARHGRAHSGPGGRRLRHGDD